MRQTGMIALVAMLCGGAVSCSVPGTALFSLGTRQLDKSDWEPVENQTLVGFTACLEPPKWPVGIEFGLLGSTDHEEEADPFFGTLELDGRVSELFVGARKTFSIKDTPTQFFVSGGLSYVDAELEFKLLGISASASDSSGGIYLGGGAYWRLGQSFILGLDIRYTGLTDLSFGGFDTDVDGMQFGLMIGWGWPGSESSSIPERRR